jgi:hypothetical protein
VRSGQGVPLFCDEPGCERGPGGDAPFGRKDNLADHKRRKHGQSSAASSRVREKVGTAHYSVLPHEGLESPQHVDKEPVTSLHRKRKWIADMGLDGQNVDGGHAEEVDLRDELKSMRQVELDLKNELMKVEKRMEELKTELKGRKKAREEYRAVGDGDFHLLAQVSPRAASP